MFYAERNVLNIFVSLKDTHIVLRGDTLNVNTTLVCLPKEKSPQGTFN